MCLPPHSGQPSVGNEIPDVFEQVEEKQRARPQAWCLDIAVHDGPGC